MQHPPLKLAVTFRKAHEIQLKLLPPLLAQLRCFKSEHAQLWDDVPYPNMSSMKRKATTGSLGLTRPSGSYAGFSWRCKVGVQSVERSCTPNG